MADRLDRPRLPPRVRRNRHPDRVLLPQTKKVHQTLPAHLPQRLRQGAQVSTLKVEAKNKKDSTLMVNFIFEKYPRLIIIVNLSFLPLLSREYGVLGFWGP